MSSEVVFSCVGRVASSAGGVVVAIVDGVAALDPQPGRAADVANEVLQPGARMIAGCDGREGVSRA
jgi:hypothetical protein